MSYLIHADHHTEPWNKGEIVGPKTELELKDIWAIRVRPRHCTLSSAKGDLESLI